MGVEMRRRGRMATLGAIVLLTGWIFLGITPASGADSVADRLRRLEDAEEIRLLLHSYGRFLDARDFASFSGLFAEREGEWIGGMGRAKGRAAILKLMEDSIGTGTPGAPNRHVFSNEMISIDGDRAAAVSTWMFLVQAESRPQMVYVGRYEDLLVREQGRWRFLRRTVHAEIPPDAVAER